MKPEANSQGAEQHHDHPTNPIHASYPGRRHCRPPRPSCPRTLPRPGADVAYLRELTEYWRNDFDWRAEEAALNAFPQFRVPLDGIDLHYLHVPGVGPDPMPLLLLHGWPGSVFEFLELIPRLTDPARFGGDARDAFTVVAPSLPGYGRMSLSAMMGPTADTISTACWTLPALYFPAR